MPESQVTRRTYRYAAVTRDELKPPPTGDIGARNPGNRTPSVRPRGRRPTLQGRRFGRRGIPENLYRSPAGKSNPVRPDSVRRRESESKQKRKGPLPHGMKQWPLNNFGMSAFEDYRPLLKSSRISSRAMIILLTSEVPAPISQSF